VRQEVIARNYAEALFTLAEPGGDPRLERYGELIEVLARVVDASPEVQAVLMSPKVPKAVKGQVLGQALARVGAPRELVLYLQAVVKRGRQYLLGEIAQAYHELLDQKHNRVRAAVTVAREPDAALREALVEALSRTLGKEVVASFTVDAGVLGGTVIRVGDRVYDGSLKRRLVRLRRQLLQR